MKIAGWILVICGIFGMFGANRLSLFFADIILIAIGAVLIYKGTTKNKRDSNDEKKS